MKTVYLHFGMPKAGSTSIQKAFYNFKNENIKYAELEESNHGVPLVAAFSEKPENFYIIKNRGIDVDDARNMAKIYRAQVAEIMEGASDTIFSSEAVPDHMTPQEIENLVAFFRARSDEVKVIFYARPISSLVSSQFQQGVKQGASSFTLPAPKYRKRFEAVVKAIGHENVTFIRFSRENLIGGDIIKDFAHRVGISTPPSGSVGNESLSLEAVGSIYFFNKIIAPHLPPKQRFEIRNALKRKLSGLGGQKFMLHPDLICQHISDHQDDIRWAEDLCGFDLVGEIATSATEVLVSSEADLISRFSIG